MKMFELIKYICIDIKRDFILKKNGYIKFNEFGLRLYEGAQGSGKSMSMVYQLEEYRKNFGKSLFIATNFGYVHEDFCLSSFEDIPNCVHLAKEKNCTGVVIGWDEIQNDFDSQTRTYPIAILRTITQQRKQGIKILATSQVFTRVAKAIREQTFEVVSCKTYFNRLTVQRFYNPIDYEFFIANPDKKKKLDLKKKFSFVQTDELRELYDSFAVIKNLAKYKD